MSGDVTLLINPVAGRGKGARAAGPAAAVLREAGFPVRCVVADSPRDTVRRAREAIAQGTRAVVAVGGDGMVSLALAAVARTGTPLGVVPGGTGNDFARACQLPVGDPAAAGSVIATALKREQVRDVDLGHVTGTGGGTWFGSVLAAGFDSRVTDRGNRMRWPRGRLRYNVAMVAELAALRAEPFRIRLDDGPWRETEATLVAVGNGPSYGGGMRICAGALVDDGQLTITVVGRCGRRTLLRVFPRVYRGTHLSHPVVSVHQAARVTIDAPGVTGYADGESVGTLPVTVACVPGAVRLLAPPRPLPGDPSAG